MPFRMFKRWIAFVFLAVVCLYGLRSFTRISEPEPIAPPSLLSHPHLPVPLPPVNEVATPVSGGSSIIVGQDPTLVEGPDDWRDVPLQNPLDSFVPIPSGDPGVVPRIQHDFSKYRESPGHVEERTRRRTAVKDAFLYTWKGYKDHAWLHDEVGPLSGNSKETYGGWAATLVDSLDVLWLMGLQDEFDDALVALKKIDFTSSTATALNTFETIIRYVGGLLGAYDLSGGKHPILLQKATELGEMIYHAFDTPNHLPMSRWNWKNSASGINQTASHNLVIAELGSLTMEFTRLTQLTGDPKFYDLVHRITRLMAREQMLTMLPGLWPTAVNGASENLHDGISFTLGGQADSVYEYLPKQYILLNGRDSIYKDMYVNAVDAFKRYLVYEPLIPLQRNKQAAGPEAPKSGGKSSSGADDTSLPLEAFDSRDDHEVLQARDYEFSPDYSNPLLLGTAQAFQAGTIDLDTEGQHLACFAGGMVALGVRAFAPHINVTMIEEEMDVAERLTAGCVWSYRNTATGIGPERYHTEYCRRGRAAVASGGKNETDWTGEKADDCRWDRDRWMEGVRKRHMRRISPQANAKAEAEDPDRWETLIRDKRIDEGFTEVDDPRYLLRPEAIESVFYLWRVTGDPKFQEQAWAMFEAIQREARTDIAYASLRDVRKTRASLQQKEDEADAYLAKSSAGTLDSSPSSGGQGGKGALGGLMSGLGLSSSKGDTAPREAGPAAPPTTTTNLEDVMESFWPAETLKYFYLMFVEPEVMSLDRFVLNTEAHPFYWREGPPPPRPVKDLYSHWGND